MVGVSRSNAPAYQFMSRLDHLQDKGGFLKAGESTDVPQKPETPEDDIGFFSVLYDFQSSLLMSCHCGHVGPPQRCQHRPPRRPSAPPRRQI